MTTQRFDAEPIPTRLRVETMAKHLGVVFMFYEERIGDEAATFNWSFSVAGMMTGFSMGKVPVTDGESALWTGAWDDLISSVMDGRLTKARESAQQTNDAIDAHFGKRKIA
jgi:hypothetical protein